MNIGFSSKTNPETCAHTQTVAVNTIGIQRSICESCNHVSVNFIDDIETDVDRTAFAREADDLRTVEVLDEVSDSQLATTSA